MHDWLIWLVLEVAVPTALELRSRPVPHLLEFFFRGSCLDASFDAICCERAGALELPFGEDLLLDLGITPYKVVKRLALWLGTVRCEG